MSASPTSHLPCTAKIANVQYPVLDLAGALAFYEGVFALPRLFVDGDRYAALDGGGVKLALAAASEEVVGIPAAAFKVDDVQGVLDQVVQAGGTVLKAIEAGPHEVRAVAQDPWDNAFIVYSPL